MKPIRFALLWHQHQPYYRAGNTFYMPWAWLHATKDYLEMAQHLERHPKMRATINLVPSLVKQIEEYLAGEATDPVVELMTKPAQSLTASDKEFMLQNFFLANHSTVIDPSPRYRELYSLPQEHYTGQNYRDLAVHYSLAWTGAIARCEQPFAALVEKDTGYSEEDKRTLMQAQIANVRKIIPLHKKLARRGQIEISTTPFYHPILPLLVDTNSAREAMPDVALPSIRFQAPEEAERQLEHASRFMADRFGETPKGVWPSEGSVSNATLQLLRKTGFHWTATDETVLANSLGGQSVSVAGVKVSVDHAKYFPFQFRTSQGPIAIFFRDHALSDDIGFNYQSWDAVRAANDFTQKILDIRTMLLDTYGEAILDTACVTVILDGENCWEYFPNNGYEFLEAFYSQLSSNPLIQPVTFSDVIQSSTAKQSPELSSVVAGSWINGNFKIWIGHPEDNRAWDLLANAKQAFSHAKERIDILDGPAKKRAEAALEAAHEELMIAEGSDWCWWFGDEHFSAQKNIFDELFRTHLRAVYAQLDLTAPQELFVPIPSMVGSMNDRKGLTTDSVHSQAMSRSGI